VSNTLLTTSLITQEALLLLELNLGFTLNVNREFDPKFGIEGAKIGYVVNVRRPVKYVGRTGQTVDIEDIQERSVPVVLDKQFGVDLEVSTADLSLAIDDFSKRILGPAVSRISHEVDRDGLKEFVNVYNSVGTPGTTPNALLTYLQTCPKLDDAGAPRDENRWMVISSLMEITIVDAVKALFHATAQLAQQYVKGRMGTAVGYEWVMDQNVQTHTVGAYAGTPLVNGASQTGASIITDGWTSGSSTINKGDVFTLAGVNSVRPHTRDSTGVLQQFVCTATLSDTAGAKTIQIDPPITLTGPYQTVSASPANNAALTMVGIASKATPQGLAYHRDAFCLATADLYVPNGVDMGGRSSDPQLGMSIRFIRDYDPQRDQLITRLDMLYGWKTLRAELACRVQA